MAYGTIRADLIEGTNVTIDLTTAGRYNFAGDLLADVDNTRDLGSASISWANTYTDNIYIGDGSNASPSLTFSSDPDTGMYLVGTNSLGFATNGTGALTITSGQDVGINTDSPTGVLHLVKAGDSAVLQIQQTDSVTTYRPAIRLDKQSTNLFQLSCDGNPGAEGLTYYEAKTATAQHVFKVNAVDAMRVNSDAELLIGYTSDNGAYKLQVNSQIFATSATIATSDGRYKENVQSLDGCLDLVKALRPVSFTWKPQEDITRIDEEGDEVLVREGHNFPEGAQVGFIAQEVQQVLDGKPWLGSIIKENVRPAISDESGNELAPEEQFYGIAEGNLIAVLANALQEAAAKIEDLESRLVAAGL